MLHLQQAIVPVETRFMERTPEMPGLLSFRTLKRRERRAPHSAQSRYPFARDSIALRFMAAPCDSQGLMK